MAKRNGIRISELFLFWVIMFFLAVASTCGGMFKEKKPVQTNQEKASVPLSEQLPAVGSEKAAPTAAEQASSLTVEQVPQENAQERQERRE